MPVLDTQNGAFVIDGHPWFAHAGECHYFRLDPARWPSHLRTLRELGITMVGTYVPWLWHQPEPDIYDFTGQTHPRRNLLRFLDVAQDLGLYVFIRPGPYVMAELRNEGIPSWIFRDFPEVLAQAQDGAPHPNRVVSYLHPHFLALADNWYRRLNDALMPYYRTQGGPILLVQLDNEVGMLNWVSQTPDRRPDIGEMLLPADGESQADGTPNGYFWRRYHARYLSHLKHRAQELGFPAPYVINVHGFRDFSIYSRGTDYPIGLSQLADAGMLADTFLSGDFYPGKVTFDSFHDLVLAVAYTTAMNPPGAPRFSAEFQSGRNKDRPRLDPSDLDLSARVTVAHGLNGLNWYMLIGGDNPADIGAFGYRHDWQAPVAKDGTLAPSAKTVAHLGALFATFGEALATSQPVADLAIGFYSPYYMSEVPAGTEPARAIMATIAAEREAFHFDGLYRLVIAANLTPTAIAIDRAEVLPARHPQLWVGTTEYLDPATQERLADYVIAGGILVMGPRLPRYDLDGGPCTILRDRLALPAANPTERQGFARLLTWDSVLCPSYTTFQADPAAEVWGTVEQPSSGPVLIKKAAGRGHVVMLGCALPYLYAYDVEIIRSLAAKTGVSPTVTSSHRDLHVTRRSGPRGQFLSVMNFLETPAETTLTLAAGSNAAASATLEVRVPPRSGLLLPYGGVPLPFASAWSILETTVELTVENSAEHRLVIHRGRESGHVRLTNAAGTSPTDMPRLLQGQGQVAITDGQVFVQWKTEDAPQPLLLLL